MAVAQLDVAAAAAVCVEQLPLQRAVSAHTVWLSMRCAPRWRHASARGRWRPQQWTALQPAEPTDCFRQRPRPRYKAGPSASTKRMPWQGPDWELAPQPTEQAHRVRRAAADRTKRPGAGVAASPQQSAVRLHGALRIGAHGSHGSPTACVDDGGVVEQQCSTAHESDGGIILRTEEGSERYYGTRNRSQSYITVLAGTRTHTRVQKRALGKQRTQRH